MRLRNCLKPNPGRCFASASPGFDFKSELFAPDEKGGGIGVLFDDQAAGRSFGVEVAFELWMRKNDRHLVRIGGPDQSAASQKMKGPTRGRLVAEKMTHRPR